MSHKLFCIDHLEAFLLMCFLSHKNIQEHHETSAFSSKSNKEQKIFKTLGDELSERQAPEYLNLLKL